MPVRVKCRCGQELTLRYGEWVYSFIGLVLLCLVANTVALVLLYVRLEESQAGERRAAEAALPIAAPPPAQEQRRGNGGNGENGGKRGNGEGEGEEEGKAAPPPAQPLREPGIEEPGRRAAEGSLLLGEAVDEEPWTSAPWLERGSAPEASEARRPEVSISAFRDEALVRLRLLDLGRESPLVLAGFLLDPDARLRMLAADAILALEPPVPDGADSSKVRALAGAALPDLPSGIAETLRARLGLAGGGGTSGNPSALREALEAFDRRLEDSRKAPGVGELRDAIERARARGLDVVLCIDATRSMEGLHDALAGDMSWLFPAVEWGFPDAQIGIVIYRDDVEASRGFSRPGDVESAALIQSSRAEGGGDVPEGVHHALRHALSLGKFAWRKGSEKHVILIGDAPPPYREQRSTLWLAGRGLEQGGFRLHVLAPKLDDGKPEPFLAELSRSGGGTYTTVSPSPGEDILACLLPRSSGPTQRPLTVSLRALFAAAPAGRAPTRKEG